MRIGVALAGMATFVISGTVAWAQPADLPIPAATTSEYPPGVKVGKAGNSQVYTDSQGHTLYGMDMRMLLRFGADTSKYCQGPCAQTWEPLLAPDGSKANVIFPQGFGDRNRQAAAIAGAGPSAPPPQAPPSTIIQNQKAPDWTIIDGPQGPQWVYKGWHMVYIRKGEAPGSAAYDGAEEMVWNTLKFVPPLPQVSAPGNVSTAFIDGAYALVAKDGRLLFTGTCGEHCADWLPLKGSLASRGTGDWTVDHDTDSPQWRYRGNPVFVAQGTNPAEIPSGAALLRP